MIILNQGPFTHNADVNMKEAKGRNENPNKCMY
jgi:hypothetical protein